MGDLVDRRDRHMCLPKQWSFIVLVTGITAQAIFVSIRGVVFGLDSSEYLTCWKDVRRNGYLPFLLFSRINKYFFFLPTYPWHSIRHQIVNAAIFLSLYALAAYGVCRVIKYCQENLYFLAGMACAQILYHLLVSVCFSVEPDHRFLVPSFPSLVILASLGAASFLPTALDAGSGAHLPRGQGLESKPLHVASRCRKSLI